MAKAYDVVIVHGCPGDEERAMDPEQRTYDKHWMPWLGEELTMKGLRVARPLMPEPWSPRYEAFKEEFEEYPISEETILIGHSCGCAFLVHWLGETKQKAKKLILVAPWKVDTRGSEKHKKFYGFPIDKTLPERVGKIVMFTSDDLEAEGNEKKSLKMYTDALGGRVIDLQGMGHYTLGDMGTEKFPQILEEITEKEQ